MRSLFLRNLASCFTIGSRLVLLFLASAGARGDDAAVLSGAIPKGTVSKETVLKGAVSKGIASKGAAPKGSKAEASAEDPTRTMALPYLTLMLARDPAVQADLRLTRKQAAGVQAAVAQVDGPLWQLHDVPVQQCGDKLNALLAQLQKGLKDSLTAAQF